MVGIAPERGSLPCAPSLREARHPLNVSDHPCQSGQLAFDQGARIFNRACRPARAALIEMTTTPIRKERCSWRPPAMRVRLRRLLTGGA